MNVAKAHGLTNAVGDTIRRMRQEQGKTLREVAKDSHVSLGHLSEVERGGKQASFEVIESVAHGLNITTSQLIKEIYEYLEEHNK
jgi:transcriptional regulator with XRE-family HTH domain